MKRTTVFLPEDLKLALERVSRQRGCTEAELIREGVRTMLGEPAHDWPRPKMPLFTSANPLLTDPARLDEAMEGFGED